MLEYVFSMISILFWNAALSRRYFHMYQLNSYFPERYARWLKANSQKGKYAICLVLGVITALGFGLYVSPLLLGFGLLEVFKKREEKKPFVVTARVKRQFMAATVLMLGIFSAGFILPENYRHIYTAIIALVPFMVFLPTISGKMTVKIEKRIADGFVTAARDRLKGQNLTVVGVTGSYGKTSVKHIITEILSEKYNTLMTQGSYNTTMGVVRTINENMTPYNEVFVCEMGARHIGDIAEICEIVGPKYGVITSVGIAHLETFGSTDNIKKAKFELVDSLPEDGLAFLNFDSQAVRESGYSRPYRSYGISEGCDYRAVDMVYSQKGVGFAVITPSGERVEFTSKLLGRHSVANITGGVAVAIEMGVPIKQIQAAVKRIKPIEHRLELKAGIGGRIYIDDAYNSNPEGAAEAAFVLSSFEGIERILVTPGMVELGDKQDAANREFGKIAANCCDKAILVGKGGKAIAEGFELAGQTAKVTRVDNLKEALALLPEGECVVLLENDLTDDYEVK